MWPENNLQLHRNMIAAAACLAATASQQKSLYDTLQDSYRSFKVHLSDSQSANTPSPKVGRFEPGSNLTVERRVQGWKQNEEMVLTDGGMEID
jgi:hypothetical protein